MSTHGASAKPQKTDPARRELSGQAGQTRPDFLLTPRIFTDDLKLEGFTVRMPYIIGPICRVTFNSMPHGDSPIETT